MRKKEKCKKSYTHTADILRTLLHFHFSFKIWKLCNSLSITFNFKLHLAMAKSNVFHLRAKLL